VALLDVREVSVRFGGLQALADVSIGIEVGHVNGLIGPNGAGKTTLFNAITGVHPTDSGRVLLDGNDITYAKPHRRARLGIGRTFQRLETFGTLSARENVLVAAEMRRGWSRERFDVGALADEIIERVGLGAVAHERVDRLPTGTARLVEVARALANKPRVLLLDEPSSGLNEAETGALSALLRELASTNLGVLLVEHDMSFVMGACGHIDVLDFGRVIARGAPEEIRANATVRAAYLGSGDDERTTDSAGASSPGRVAVSVSSEVTADGEAADAALALRGVTAGYGAIDVLHGVDLAVRPGQVFALLGPNGAGKSTTLKVASGQLKPTRGEVFFRGREVTGASPDALAREGVCLVANRGIFPNLTVAENLRMATHTGTPLRDVLERAFEQFPILKGRRKQVAGTLSGGEQQMLSMVRAMVTDPKVLLFDELSMGLAPLIVEELYGVVKRIAAADVSILIIEQFAYEVLGVADIAAIMLNGRVQYRGDPAEVGEALDAAYLGGAVEA
jgi:branched-chain amino acid transport system ATP-binding protein